MEVQTLQTPPSQAAALTTPRCHRSSSGDDAAPQGIREELSVADLQEKLAFDEDDGNACRVCGDEQAKMHYGVLACFGCKGFFRRALKRADQYECRNGGRCTIDKYERNSCRYCRLRKCLEVGMDPNAVRPDRDFSSKQVTARIAMRRPPQRQIEAPPTTSAASSSGGEDWMKRLPVDMRTTLMQLLNIEFEIAKGDTNREASLIYPLKISSLRAMIEDPSILDGKRTEMRYEPYRMAKNNELSVIAFRRLIAAIDWVEHLCEMMDPISVDDQMALVESCFAPLMIFKFAARTADVTDNKDVLCLCNFAYVPRDIAKAYTDSYHLGNGLVERTLNELVEPFRRIGLREEEIVAVSAILVLNPYAKKLSRKASELVMELRGRVQDTLYNVIKESRPHTLATTHFGNLLLFLPVVANLSNLMCENLQFAQTFSSQGSIPLLTQLFGCFPVEPFEDLPVAMIEDVNDDVDAVYCDVSTQTDNHESQHPQLAGDEEEQPATKRRAMSSAVTASTVVLQNTHNSSSGVAFRLLQAPCAYTLTEMFDDRINDECDEMSGGKKIAEGGQQIMDVGENQVLEKFVADGLAVFRAIQRANETNMRVESSTAITPMVETLYDSAAVYRPANPILQGESGSTTLTNRSNRPSIVQSQSFPSRSGNCDGGGVGESSNWTMWTKCPENVAVTRQATPSSFTYHPQSSMSTPNCFAIDASMHGTCAAINVPIAGSIPPHLTLQGTAVPGQSYPMPTIFTPSTVPYFENGRVVFLAGGQQSVTEDRNLRFSPPIL